MSSCCNPSARASNLTFETSPAALRPSPYQIPCWSHLIWFLSAIVRPYTCSLGKVTALPPPSDAMYSPSLSCVDKDIVVVFKAATVALVITSVDEVVILVARHGGQCHAFLVVVVLRRFFCRRRHGVALLSPPPRLSLPGGAITSVEEVIVLVARHDMQCHAFLVVIERRQVHRCRRRRRRWVISSLPLPPQISLSGVACANVMPPPKIASLWPCPCPPRTAQAGGRALTVVSAGGGVAIIYLVSWLHCMYLDCNGPSPAPTPPQNPTV